MQSNYTPAASSNTVGWHFFTSGLFAFAAGMTALGVWALPTDLWVKGYLIMASLFLCGLTFTLAKTPRDE